MDRLKYNAAYAACRPILLMGVFEQFNALFVCLIRWLRHLHTSVPIMDNKYNGLYINYYSLFID